MSPMVYNIVFRSQGKPRGYSPGGFFVSSGPASIPVALPVAERRERGFPRVLDNRKERR
jgi:hypothetical protein